MLLTSFIVKAQYSISGQVWDQDLDTGIGFATVALFQDNSGTIIQGNLSDPDGSFEFRDLPEGIYSIKINYLGFTEKAINTINTSQSITLGKINLAKSSESLKEFEVKGRRSYVQYGLEKKVFNVEDNLASMTGDATELLRNIPSITIDQDDNISLRGNQNIRILINGKESGLAGLDRRALLSQIDAASIKNIEVITNPSAKYDPEGSAGIINITTKKLNKKGFNLVTNINGGTGPRANASISSNLKIAKWNLTAGYSGRYNETYRLGITDRTTYLNGIDSLYRQYYIFDGRPTDVNHNASFGAEYILNPNTSISINGNLGISDELDPATRISDFYDSQGNRSHYANRFEDETESGNTKELNANFNKIYEKADQNLDISIRYSDRRDNDNSFISDSFFFDNDSYWYTILQSSGTKRKSETAVAQLDYTHPLSKTKKIETGLKLNQRIFGNDYTLNNVDLNSGIVSENDQLSNHFIYKERIGAAYGIWNQEISNLAVQMGLRYEYTNTLATLVDNNYENDNEYHMLFPSAALSYSLGKKQSVQLTYSRRINRPRTRTLNPFTDFSDPSNLRTGNPDLLPETINSYELSYQISMKKATIATSAFHKETNQIIQRITEIQNDSVRISTFTNLSSGQNSGLELILSLRPAKWWNINTNYSFYYSKLDGRNIDANLSNTGYMGSGRIMSMMNFKKGFGVQFSGFYRTPMVRIQGTTAAIYSFDLSVQKKILKNKGVISLRLSDIFDTREWNYYSSESNNFELSGTWKRQSRLLIAGFRYSLQQEKRGGRGNRGRSDMRRDDMDF
jgi:iron complex outermembrane receptor protein